MAWKSLRFNEAGGPKFLGLMACINCQSGVVHRLSNELLRTAIGNGRRSGGSGTQELRHSRRARRIVRRLGFPKIVNVNVALQHRFRFAQSIRQRNDLSHPEAPPCRRRVMQDLRVAEGAHVVGGAIVQKSVVGQGCRRGKLVSAEHCLLSQLRSVSGEAVSFAGARTPSLITNRRCHRRDVSFYNGG